MSPSRDSRQGPTKLQPGSAALDRSLPFPESLLQKRGVSVHVSEAEVNLNVGIRVPGITLAFHTVPPTLSTAPSAPV